MTTTPISLQDLRRKIYAKAKAEPHWRFWGLYVHLSQDGDAARCVRDGQSQ